VAASGFTLAELALIQPTYGDYCKTRLFEMHYNNSGTDVNEYIEVRQTTDASPGVFFTSILFYDENGSLYKTLPQQQMQYVAAGNLLTYTFAANESFADRGRVDIINTLNSTPTIISSITYNENSVSVLDNTGSLSSTWVYNIGESESTPAGQSLQFLGTCFNPALWNLHSAPASMNAQNPGLSIAPIRLSRFNAIAADKQVRLDWTTSFELNNRFFVLERSFDGRQFAPLAQIAGAGNSNSSRSYSFTDYRPGIHNYYRLATTDAAGNISYSPVVTAEVKEGAAMRILQNPVAGSLPVQVVLTASQLNTLQIYDVHGRMLHQQPAINGLQTIDVSQLPAGQYLLRLSSKEGKAAQEWFFEVGDLTSYPLPWRGRCIVVFTMQSGG
jgi:hypothetical protein